MYMSPELINSRNGAKGYDGKQVRMPFVFSALHRTL